MFRFRFSFTFRHSHEWGARAGGDQGPSRVCTRGAKDRAQFTLGGRARLDPEKVIADDSRRVRTTAKREITIDRRERARARFNRDGKLFDNYQLRYTETNEC